MTLLIWAGSDFGALGRNRKRSPEKLWGLPIHPPEAISTTTLNLKITFPPIWFCLLSIVFISLHSKVTEQATEQKEKNTERQTNKIRPLWGKKI